MEQEDFRITPYYEEQILEFIKRRWGGTDAHWFDGNCGYFAKILIDRFPQLGLYYFPIEGHFVAGDGRKFYDASGVVKL